MFNVVCHETLHINLVRWTYGICIMETGAGATLNGEVEAAGEKALLNVVVVVGKELTDGCVEG